MRRKILGVNVDFGLTVKDVLLNVDKIVRKGYQGKAHLISTTNPYFIASALDDSEFKSIINNSLLSVPDGVGVLYANYYLNNIQKYKNYPLFPVLAFFIGLISGLSSYFDKIHFGSTITGVELTYKLCELASARGYSVFLLGGRRRTAKGQLVNDGYDMSSYAAKCLMSLYPNLRVIGSSSAFSRDPVDDANTITYIHNCMHIHNIKHIDILLIAYNPIYQEKWIHRNANKIPSIINIGIGRTFDYITEEMKQPNKIYEILHIAWLCALIKQPWRFKRVFMTILIFPIKVYKESINMNKKKEA